MRLKVSEIGGALHPSEVVVEIRTATVPERLTIDRRSLQEGNYFRGLAPVSRERSMADRTSARDDEWHVARLGQA